MPISSFEFLLVLASCLVLLFLGLFLERMVLEKRLQKIRLRICVTGTRGKSTVTRLILSSLREAGFKVLAKTTGSKPVMIFPDGSESEIERPGLPSILEQKKVLKLAAAIQADTVVAEMMSIQPQYLFVEAHRLLKPQVLVITNVRLDHMDEMGKTRPEIAQSLASAISAGSTVFIPEEERFPEFEEAARRVKVDIIRVEREPDQLFLDSAGRPLFENFEENVRLALAVSRHLGVAAEIALKGMSQARSDFGSLKIWEAPLGTPTHPHFLVSAFAANDPDSTQKVLRRLEEKIPLRGKKLIGLLNFRRDRGERTLQWIEALNRGSFDGFDRIFFIGAHVHSLKIRRLISSRKIRATVLGAHSPEKITAEIASGEGAVIIGMGNIGGLGQALIEYWQTIGVPYGA